MGSNDTLLPHQALAPNQSLRSPNGRAILVYQQDGNLVLYFDSQPLWDSRTAGVSPGQAIMQGDGNFVVYDAAGAPAWASGTEGNGGASITVHDDGTWAVYLDGAPIMTTNTVATVAETMTTVADVVTTVVEVVLPAPAIQPEDHRPEDHRPPVHDAVRPHGGLETLSADPAVRPGFLPGIRLPERGAFRFPAPYHTEAFRITNASDGEVLPRNYSYWRQTNDHASADHILVFAGIRGAGPTLFSLHKRTGHVEKIGPLFTGTPLEGATGEGMYFSAIDPQVLYCAIGSTMMRYRVGDRSLTPVFDASECMHRRVLLWQMHTAYDDRTHSATVRDAGTGADLGACVFREAGGQFAFIERRGDYDECQIDKSGDWLVIKENVDGRNGEDNRIVNVHTLAERTFLDEAGAAGHSDNGFGYIVGEDNWHARSAAVRVWNLADLDAAPGGALVYHTTEWGAGVGHVSHANARRSLPVARQWAWVSNATPKNLPRANEIITFPLDGSLRVIVVAPNLVQFTGDLYDDLPKGNCDLTGEYFLWVGSPEGRRDLLMVHLPQR
jgi:hypothetical protein